MSTERIDVRTLYETTLRPRLEGLEGLRRDLKGMIVKAALLGGLPLLGVWASDYLELWRPGLGAPVAIVSWILVFIGLTIASLWYFLPAFTANANYKARFKQQIVAEVFKIVSPSAEYAPFKSIAKEIFDEPGLFNSSGGYWSDDRVRGRIGATVFEAADVRRVYTTGSGQRSTRHVVFEGLFFHLDFNKALRGVTFVQPEGARASQLGDRTNLRAVSLENPDFEKQFAVYASDEVEARYILTPAMMERLVSLQQRTEHPVFLAFKHNRAYIGVHYGRSLFEPGVATTTSLEAIEEMAEHFALASFIVHELDLNTRIWTKDVDEALLHQEHQEMHPLHSPILTSGSVTEEDVLNLVKSLTSTTTEDQDEPASAPPDTRIRVHRDASGATIAYGLPLSFFVLLAITAASIVVAGSAVRVVGQAMQPGFVSEVATILPEIPRLDALVAELPWAFLGGAFLVGAIVSTIWALRVRRVAISRDAVAIARGLRPFPRRYPRPLYGRVVRLERAVYVGKMGSSSLLNPSASPMLRSEAEAKWIASEMRRALKETA